MDQQITIAVAALTLVEASHVVQMILTVVIQTVNSIFLYIVAAGRRSVAQLLVALSVLVEVTLNIGRLRKFVFSDTERYYSRYL